jgi:phage-related protein
MARGTSQYLRIFTAGGGTRHRWQSYYSYRPVTWQGAEWSYVAFTADGFTAGVSGDETNVTISAPATPLVQQAFEQAVIDGQFVEMLMYQFNSAVSNITPLSSQVLIGRYVGQVVGGIVTATTFALQLGSALSPVGAQFPPRKLTTAIMGQGAVL